MPTESPRQDGQSVQMELDALPPYIRRFSKRAHYSLSPVQAQETGGGGAAESGTKGTESITVPAQFIPPPSIDPNTIL